MIGPNARQPRQLEWGPVQPVICNLIANVSADMSTRSTLLIMQKTLVVEHVKVATHVIIH